MNVVRKNVGQQLPRDGPCVLWRIAACMLQFVREDTNEAIIIRWCPVEVCLLLLSGEEDGLHRSATAVCLDPAFASFLQCASPKSQHVSPESRVGQFKHDAANIFIGEEVLPRELHFVEEAVCVEEERIAAPTHEQGAVAGFRHHSFLPDRDRCSLDDNFALVARPRGWRALHTA